MWVTLMVLVLYSALYQYVFKKTLHFCGEGSRQALKGLWRAHEIRDFEGLQALLNWLY